MNQAERKRRQIELCAAIVGLINILIFGKLVGNNGIAYLTIAYTGFALIQAFLTGGIADALGKMLRVRNGKGQYKNVLYVRKRVLLLQSGLALVCSLLCVIGAGSIASNLFQVPYDMLMIMLLAPALVLRTISAVLIGGFRGDGTELPAAVAAPLRQILLLGMGVVFVNIFGAYGSKVSALLGDTAYTAMYGAVGVVVAINLAELFVLAFLGVVMLGNRHTKIKEGMKQTDSLFDTVKVLYGTRWIPMVLQILEILPLWIGALFYRKSVSDVAAFAENLGLLVGGFLAVCGIAVLVICVVLSSVNAKIIGALKKDDMRSAKAFFRGGIHSGMVNALFATVFVAVMAEYFAGMVVAANAQVLADMFRYGSLLILFGTMFFYFSRLLSFTGKKYYLLGVTAISDVLFIILTTVLLNAGKAGIMSLIYAAVAAVATGCLLLGLLCCKLLHSGVDWLQIIVIPAGAASVAGLLVMLVGKVMFPHLGNPVTLLVCLLLAIIVYWALLLLLRSFREQELKYIPGGRLIYAVGQTLRIF